jgi:hypothetical protein
VTCCVRLGVVSTAQASDVPDRQASWFEVEMGEAYLRKGVLGKVSSTRRVAACGATDGTRRGG